MIDYDCARMMSSGRLDNDWKSVKTIERDGQKKENKTIAKLTPFRRVKLRPDVHPKW